MGKKMGASITSFSRWLWSGKSKMEAARNKSPACVNVTSVSYPMLKGPVMDLNCKGVGDMKIDGDYDAVLVPKGDDDGTESGELDWSIGWLESFSPEFQSDDESDGSFAVLVPNYGPGCIEGCKGPNTLPVNVIRGVSCDYSAEGRKYMEQWLSSLQGR